MTVNGIRGAADLYFWVKPLQAGVVRLEIRRNANRAQKSRARDGLVKATR